MGMKMLPSDTTDSATIIDLRTLRSCFPMIVACNLHVGACKLG
jgi:hypothetical protein